MSLRTRLLLVVALLVALLAPSASSIGLPGSQVPAADASFNAEAIRAASVAFVPPAQAPTPVPPTRPRSYTVRPGDTLVAIAQRFEVGTAELIRANDLGNPDNLSVGQRLTIPAIAAAGSDAGQVAAVPPSKRGSALERLPDRAREAAATSPFYRTTWVTYYGRPNVPILGILGEFSIDQLVPILREQAHAYDEANGPELGVKAAFHLIYGMASAGDGADGSHLVYMDDGQVQQYIDRAAWEGMGVILDVQIGNRTPLQSLEPAFKFLKYNNVQLALDPEFAMTKRGQTIPGNPPGTVTAEQVNEAQHAILDYMQSEGLQNDKMLIVHQFLPWMIENKDDLEELDGLDLVICADGFGPPWPKVSKYNVFMAENTQFAAFKLFYRWDEPIMNERQTLGVDNYPGVDYMEKTPSLIIYQ